MLLTHPIWEMWEYKQESHHCPISNYFNMTPFIGYINNVMLDLLIYFTSHMRIAWQNIDNMVISYTILISCRV